MSQITGWKKEHAKDVNLEEKKERLKVTTNC